MDAREPDLISELPSPRPPLPPGVRFALRVVLPAALGWWLLSTGMDRLWPDSAIGGLVALWLAMFVALVLGADHLRAIRLNLAKVALAVWAIGGIGGFAGYLLFLSPELPTDRPAADPLPDVAMRFVHPKSPASILGNFSDAVAEGIKWGVILANLSDPSTFEEEGLAVRFVPIPFRTFDFLRGRSGSGSMAFLEGAPAASQIHPGDRLFGYSSVTCPKCVRVRMYWLFIEVGRGGWSAEAPENSYDGKRFVELVRGAAKVTNPDEWLLDFVPADKRVAIAD
jgi:hypothetical protein